MTELAPLESEYATNLGLSGVNVAEACRACWHRCREQEVPVDRNETAKWIEAVEPLFELCEQQQEISWRELTEKFQERIVGNLNHTPEVLRLTFEACVRLGVNIIMAEDAEDLEEARSYDWPKWIVKKLNKKEPQDGSDSREDREDDGDDD